MGCLALDKSPTTAGSQLKTAWAPYHCKTGKDPLVNEIVHNLHQTYPEGNTNGICNQNLPNTSVYNRFIYMIQVGPLFLPLPLVFISTFNKG